MILANYGTASPGRQPSNYSSHCGFLISLTMADNAIKIHDGHPISPPNAPTAVALVEEDREIHEACQKHGKGSNYLELKLKFLRLSVDWLRCTPLLSARDGDRDLRSRWDLMTPWWRWSGLFFLVLINPSKGSNSELFRWRLCPRRHDRYNIKALQAAESHALRCSFRYY